MAARSTVILTTGQAGSGKTYRRCAKFLVDEFLPKENGKIISNYPINREVMAAEVARKTGKDLRSILDRIVIIPKTELDKWMLRWERRNADKAEGPWTYFKDTDIDGCHIAIDEIHNFCGVSTPKHQRQFWGNWLGEIRHRGATVEFLTQSPNKLADEIKWEASIRVFLVNRETKRDPIFRIPLADWYEILGAYTGGYENKIDYVEKRCIDGKWMDNHKSSFILDPYYFQFYDSYVAPHSGGGVKATEEIHECQKHSKAGILWWFFLKHPIALLSRVAIFMVFVWICFLGGGSKMLGSLTGHLQQLSHKHSKQPEIKAKPVIKNAPATAKQQIHSKPATVRDANTANLLIAEQARKIEQLQQQLAMGNAVKLCTDDSVVFHEGYSYRVGETIDFGSYKGKKVQKIDWSRRIVYLSGSVVLRMGH